MSSFCIFFVNSRYSDKTQRFYKNYTIVVLKAPKFPAFKTKTVHNESLPNNLSEGQLVIPILAQKFQPKAK